MDKKELFVSWLRRFGLIHGLTMMMVYLIFALAHPNAVFDVPFLGKMILFSLAGTLPGFVCYSSREISEKEWWIRTIIHYVLLNVLLLPVTFVLGLCSDMTDLLLYMGMILTVDVLVHALSFGLDWVVARDINKKLQQRHRNGV